MHETDFYVETNRLAEDSGSGTSLRNDDERNVRRNCILWFVVVLCLQRTLQIGVVKHSQRRSYEETSYAQLLMIGILFFITIRLLSNKQLARCLTRVCFLVLKRFDNILHDADIFPDTLSTVFKLSKQINYEIPQPTQICVATESTLQYKQTFASSCTSSPATTFYTQSHIS